MPAVARASIAFASCATRRLEFICSPVLPTRRSPIRVENERRLWVRQFLVGWSRGVSGSGAMSAHADAGPLRGLINGCRTWITRSVSV